MTEIEKTKDFKCVHFGVIGKRYVNMDQVEKFLKVIVDNKPGYTSFRYGPNDHVFYIKAPQGKANQDKVSSSGLWVIARSFRDAREEDTALGLDFSTCSIFEYDDGDIDNKWSILDEGNLFSLLDEIAEDTVFGSIRHEDPSKGFMRMFRDLLNLVYAYDEIDPNNIAHYTAHRRCRV